MAKKDTCAYCGTEVLRLNPDPNTFYVKGRCQDCLPTKQARAERVRDALNARSAELEEAMKNGSR